MATGSLTLIAGREGLGKSTVAYSLAADLTRAACRAFTGARPRRC